MPKYAQHFLINRHAAERIVEALHLTPDDVVLEIGPGKGALTSLLVAQTKQVVAIEIDLEMAELLHAKFNATGKFTIIHKDILKFDLNELKNVFKVVGNLPYNLTSPILRKLSEWSGWSEALVMVQKEVGERMCASAGTPEYGALTVGMNLTCAMEFVFELSETSFTPAPKVKSCVVRLRRREKPLVNDVNAAQKIIQAAFQQRRKTILNSLSHGLSLTKAQVKDLLVKAGLSAEVRPETVDIKGFIRLAEILGVNTPSV